MSIALVAVTRSSVSRMDEQRLIYLDYQAATPVDPVVVEVVFATSADEFANPHSEDHALGWRAKEAVEKARESVATAIGALPEEIIFTSGATEADNLGVLGAALGAPPSRRRILVSAFEHKAVLEAAWAAERLGFSVELIPVSRSGIVDLGWLRANVSPDVAVVSVMAVNNEIGTVQPVREAAEIANRAGAFSHTDATQAPLAMQVDVLEWDVDAASFSSHKVHGPKGIGALYLATSAPWRPKPLMFGGGQEGGLRPGTLPVPLCAGFGTAMELVRSKGGRERDRIASMREQLIQRLRAAVPSATVTCESSVRHPGSLHVRLPGVNAQDLLSRLNHRICAATGSACTSGVMGTSHVLAALGFSAVEAGECVRFSIGRFTTVEEIATAAEMIVEASGLAATQPR